VLVSEQVEQVLDEWQATRDTDADTVADPELEAVRLAILFEDVFGVSLAERDIDLAVLSDPAAVANLLGGGR
jgi:hypothetical protein